MKKLRNGGRVVQPANLGEMQALLSFFPPEDQKKEVAIALATHDAKANLAKKKLVALQDFSRTLLQDLMTAMPRVTYQKILER